MARVGFETKTAAYKDTRLGRHSRYFRSFKLFTKQRKHDLALRSHTSDILC